MPGSGRPGDRGYDIRDIHEKKIKFIINENKDEPSNNFKNSEDLSIHNNINLYNIYQIENNINENKNLNYNLIQENPNNFQKVNDKITHLKKINSSNECEHIFPDNKKIENNNNYWLEQSNKYYLCEIFKKYEHIPLKNYFLFKNLIICQGKYGTVWFGIDVNKSELVAIKSENKIESIQSLEHEIDVMNKLDKYKIFSKFYDRIEVIDRIFLVETLNGPTIEKLRNFCVRKFSVKTIYRIGIELITCLKFFHSSGFIYLDLKCDNISILLSPIKIYNTEMHLTLIDYGFSEKYINSDGSHYTKDKSVKVHRNSYLASINSLSKNAVSRRDDMISLCYLLIELYLGNFP